MKDLFPALLIGTSALTEVPHLGFRKIFLENVTVREHLNQLALTRGKDVLLTDYDMLSGSARSILLKFVEEYSGRCVVYSSQDRFTEIVLSRFKVVIKRGDPQIFEPDSTEAVIMDSPQLFPIYMNKGPLARKVIRSWN